MATKTTNEEWSKSDKRYGWRFGELGFVNVTEAAEILRLSKNYVSELADEAENGPRSPENKAWPLRVEKKDEALAMKERRLCKRSVIEYAKRREPQEA